MKDYKNTHFTKLFYKTGEDFQNAAGNYYNLGEATILANVQRCLDKGFGIEEIKEFIRITIDKDELVSDYVHEIKKDFKEN